MKYFIIVFFLIASHDSPGQASTTRPELVNANENILPTSRDAASMQARSWKARKDMEPANATAWFNYYLWTARDKQLQAGNKEKQLAEIVNEAEKNIINKPQYDLMLYLQSGKKDSASMHRLMAVGTDKFITYPYIIQFLSETKNDPALKDYCTEWEKISPLRRDLYQYHYNTLMSAGTNAVIYAKGVNDLVPMTILQQVYGVRKDIQLETYDEHLKNEENAYLCISLGKDVLAKYPQATYTGLLVKISGDYSGNELKGHFENDLDLSIIKNNDPVSTEAVQLYKNYLPSFILLYNYYKKTGNAAAAGIKSLIEQIAGNAGVLEEINKLIGQ